MLSFKSKLDLQYLDDIYSLTNNEEQSLKITKSKTLSELTGNTIFYNGLFVECENKNKLIGIINFTFILNECHILNFIISLNYRGNNYSDILLYKTIKNCTSNNIKFITLEVKSSNTTAIKLYKKYGFSQIGIRKRYYNNTEDALVLWTSDITSPSYRDYIDKTFTETLGSRKIKLKEM